MKKHIFTLTILFALAGTLSCSAQKLNMRALTGAAKAVSALTLTDQQIAGYVSEFIKESDAQNEVLGPETPYGSRLAKLTNGLTEAEGVPLNFKAYNVRDVNAFACADGSVRIYAGLMDTMTDDELLGVIGHEIGHIANKDTKDAFRTALLTSALRDGVASTGGTAATLSDSQLGDLGEALSQSTYSQKQERDADDYGFEFLKSKDKNPWAMVYSFEKLKSMSESPEKSSKMSQLFSTHPDLDVRIQRMKERAESQNILQPENK